MHRAGKKNNFFFFFFGGGWGGGRFTISPMRQKRRPSSESPHDNNYTLPILYWRNTYT